MDRQISLRLRCVYILSRFARRRRRGQPRRPSWTTTRRLTRVEVTLTRSRSRTSRSRQRRQRCTLTASMWALNNLCTSAASIRIPQANLRTTSFCSQASLPFIIHSMTVSMKSTPCINSARSARLCGECSFIICAQASWIAHNLTMCTLRLFI